MTTNPIGWPTAQRISDIPAVHEALEAFSHDSTEDNAVALICAVLNASPYAAGRAAGLEEAAKICESLGVDYDRREGRKWPELKSDAYTGCQDCESAIRALIASPTPSDAPKDDALDAKRLDFMTDYQGCIVCSRDGDVFSVWHRDEDGEWEPLLGYPLKFFDSPREAIDAAIAAQGEGK